MNVSKDCAAEHAAVGISWSCITGRWTSLDRCVGSSVIGDVDFVDVDTCLGVDLLLTVREDDAEI